jgi:hypothetical protein
MRSVALSLKHMRSVALSLKHMRSVALNLKHMSDDIEGSLQATAVEQLLDQSSVFSCLLPIIYH